MTIKYKYQIVLSDKRDYILEYKTFPSSSVGTLELARYLSSSFEKENVSKITITRWDGKTGEKI